MVKALKLPSTMLVLAGNAKLATPLFLFLASRQPRQEGLFTIPSHDNWISGTKHFKPRLCFNSVDTIWNLASSIAPYKQWMFSIYSILKNLSLQQCQKIIDDQIVCIGNWQANKIKLFQI